jgi:trehalose utilization protein
MRPKRSAVVAVVAAATLASVPLAAAGMMHPQLGARLTGMGEHGVVNLQSHAKQHELCWKFDLATMHPVAATVRDGGGMLVVHLGHMYRASGCAMVPKQTLALIETKPGRYWVWVATSGHPGALRGNLFAGMAHM